MIARALEPFLSVWENRAERLKSLVSDGQRIIGYFCSYTPIEVLHAAGFVPVRLIGGPGPVEKAYNLTPDFICPYMRRCLEQALNGEYAYLSGIVQGYTCDAACGCLNIWEANCSGEIFHTTPMPYNDSPEARKFMRAAVLDLAERLNGIGGHFSMSNLERSLALYGHIREHLDHIYTLRVQDRLPLSAAQLLVVVLAGFVSEPETYLAMLNDLLVALPDQRVPVNRGVPIFVSGSLIESPAYLETIEACGGRIVADDLCTGMRFFMPARGDGEDAVAALVDRHVHRMPCPARAHIKHRIDYLAKLVKHCAAQGVIFIFQKYCTPHLADFPSLAGELKSGGVPHIMIEVDESWRLSGQLHTRLEGFFETLEKNRHG
jgi:benzoyl-CoA reductase/2-hydroxyglutaryl-CoA dehydratase subunit BcrC/BadD/HgdB